MSNLVHLFRSSARELRTTRCLALTALLIACNVTLDLLGVGIKISPELRIGFGYLFNASASMLFGPVVGMVAGAATDILGYFAGNASMGAYFPGYTLTAIVGGLIYGLWLYRPGAGIHGDSTRRRVLRIVGAKACINLFCNIFLNTLWLTTVGGKALAVILPIRVAKNLILLAPECILLYFVLSFVLVMQRSMGLSTRL